MTESEMLEHLRDMQEQYEVLNRKLSEIHGWLKELMPVARAASAMFNRNPLMKLALNARKRP